MHILLHSDDLPFYFEQHGLPIYLVTGMHGTGKNTAVRTPIYCFLLSLKLNIVVVCPTGFLASTYKAEFGDSITLNTLHSPINIPIDSSQSPSMNWSLINFHVVVTDEIFYVFATVTTFSNDFILFPSFHCLFFVVTNSNFNPFKPLTKVPDFYLVFFENTFILGNASHFLITEHLCTDPAFNSFLCLIRHFNVTNRDIFKCLSSLSFTDHTEQVEAETILHAFDTNRYITFLTFNKDSSTYINSTITQHVFSNDVLLTHVYLSTDLEAWQPIYKNMKIMITENRDKEKGVINGTIAYIRSLHNQTLFIESNHLLIPIFPVSNSENHTYYPISVGSSTTICKAQGQTLTHITLFFNAPFLPCSCAYVAMS